MTYLPGVARPPSCWLLVWSYRTEEDVEMSKLRLGRSTGHGGAGDRARDGPQTTSSTRLVNGHSSQAIKPLLWQCSRYQRERLSGVTTRHPPSRSR